jgi:hypothetical protein
MEDGVRAVWREFEYHAAGTRRRATGIRYSIKISLLVARQTAPWLIPPIVPVGKPVKDTVCPIRRQLEHRAAVAVAAFLRSAIQIARPVSLETPYGRGTVTPDEGMQHLELSIRAQLKNRPSAAGAAGRRHSIEIPKLIADEARDRIFAVLTAVESVQQTECSVRRYSVNGAAATCFSAATAPTTLGRAEEVASRRIQGEAAGRISTVVFSSCKIMKHPVRAVWREFEYNADIWIGPADRGRTIKIAGGVGTAASTGHFSRKPDHCGG